VNQSPLSGVRVVVTRSKEHAGELVEKFAARGAEIVLAPTIEITDPKTWVELDVALNELVLGNYAWVMFTSVNAVTKVFGRDQAVDAFDNTKVAAVGPATAVALEEHGVRAELVPDGFEGTALAHALGRGTGRLLLPRVAGGPRSLVDQLTSLGWEVDEVDAYQNVPARPDSAGFASVVRGDFDIITFTSASTVRRLVDVVAPPAVGIDSASDGRRLVACIGPSTAAAARALGVRVDVVAPRHTLDGLVEAVCSLKDATIDG
jgi:uroporphyrinogen-III synthase